LVSKGGRLGKAAVGAMHGPTLKAPPRSPRGPNLKKKAIGESTKRGFVRASNVPPTREQKAAWGKKNGGGGRLQKKTALLQRERRPALRQRATQSKKTRKEGGRGGKRRGWKRC